MISGYIWASEASLARTCERGASFPLPLVSSPLARLVSLAQIGELACRLTYQPISARGSDPDPVVCMKVRFKAKLIGGFLSLLAANRSQSRG